MESIFHLVLSLCGGILLFDNILTGRTITVHVDALDTINNVKATTQDNEGFPSDQQCLTLEGKHPEEGRTVDCNQKESTFHF
eukprot:3928345-Karenia_brevis.AAC.1